MIPKDAIRFRIIANSNNITDQEQKLKVGLTLNKYLDDLLKEAKSKTEAEKIITNNLTTIKNKVTQIAPENNINYGENYFPEKEYHGIKYPSGNYESLVITLGKGNGHNWWCVMFPPLCLLEGKNTNQEDVQYKFLIKEIIDKYKS